MQKFRRKPIEFEAYQFLGQKGDDRPLSLNYDKYDMPYVVDGRKNREELRHGDWVVPEPDGSGCASRIDGDVFEAENEPLPEPPEKEKGTGL